MGRVIIAGTRPASVLSLFIVQVLAVCSFAGALAAIFVGGFVGRPVEARTRVVATRSPGRWADVAWGFGTTLSVIWPVLVLVAPEFGYHWPSTPDFPGSAVVQVLGFCIAIVGGALFFSARRALGRHMTPAIEVREDHRLVQEGPYRYIRHPAYTAIITAALGLSLLFLSPILGAVTLVLVGLASYRASLEEELLASPDAFGSAYQEYVARTGRFLPRPRGRSKREGPGTA